MIADLTDSVLAATFLSQPKDDACERVERFAVDDAPPGRVRGRSVRIAGNGRVAIQLQCPRKARVTCAGTLRLAVPNRLGQTLAKTRLHGSAPDDRVGRPRPDQR